MVSYENSFKQITQDKKDNGLGCKTCGTLKFSSAGSDTNNCYVEIYGGLYDFISPVIHPVGLEDLCKGIDRGT